MNVIEQSGVTRLLDLAGCARRSSRTASRTASPHISSLAVATALFAARLFPSPAYADVTIFVVADAHYGAVADSTEQNQVRAIQNLPGTPFPASIGGVVAVPDAVFVLGDLVEEAAAPDQFFTDYSGDGYSGGVPWPVCECDGNHDRQPVRDMVVGRHGELLYSVDIGGIRFQSLSDLPSVQSIASVNARLTGLPPSTPIVLFHHRPLSAPGGYINEWDPAAVDAYRSMVAGRNIVAILFGHDHYSRYYKWEGYDTYTPGSVRQSPTTAYPESFLVIRITSTTLSAASWIFGWNVNNNKLVWAGGKWGWTQQKSVNITPTPIAETRPYRLQLKGVVPNPFNPQTAVRFELPAAMPVTAEVWSVKGARIRTLVRDAQFPAGNSEIRWDGRNAQGRPIASGVYFIRIRTRAGDLVARAVLLE